jgi:antirestriction protein
MEQTPLQQAEGAVPDRLVPIAERPRIDPAPRIFAASLMDYNAGYLHGRWIGVARSVKAVQEDVNTMLARSPTAARRGTTATDWLILGNEGFGGYTVRETEPLERLTDLAQRVLTYGKAFAAWARLDEGNLDHHLRFEQAYLGHYASPVEFVDISIIDAGRYDRLIEAAVPERLRPYVDIRVDDLVRDMIDNGEIRTIDADQGGVFIFDGTVRD